MIHKTNYILVILCIFVNTLNVPVCLSRIICSDLRKVYIRKEKKRNCNLFHQTLMLITFNFWRKPCWEKIRKIIFTNVRLKKKKTILKNTQVSHFHLVQCWIHVNDRCKNFISFYNGSRIKLSAPRKDNMSQHFHIPNSFSFISEFSANGKWLRTRITSFGEHFSKDFPFSTQKRLSCPSKCRNYFICIRSS